MGQWKGRCPNPHTPKRPKIDEDAAEVSGGREFSERQRMGTPEAGVVVAITANNNVRAGKYAAFGCPGNSNVFPMRQPAGILRNPIPHTTDLRPLDPKYGWVHGESFDPLKEALEAAGARRVGP